MGRNLLFLKSRQIIAQGGLETPPFFGEGYTKIWQGLKLNSKIVRGRLNFSCKSVTGDCGKGTVPNEVAHLEPCYWKVVDYTVEPRYSKIRYNGILGIADQAPRFLLIPIQITEKLAITA